MKKIVNWIARLIARCFVSYLIAIICERGWNWLVYGDVNRIDSYRRPVREPLDFTRYYNRLGRKD